MSLIQPPSESMANYESKSSCLGTLSGWVFKILMVFLIEPSSFSIAYLEKKNSVCKSDSVWGIPAFYLRWLNAPASGK